MRKKIFAIITIAALSALMTITAFAAGAAPPAAHITLTNAGVSLTAGESSRVVLKYQNIGDGPAANATVSFGVGEIFAHAPNPSLGTIAAGGSASVEANIIADLDVAPGTYQLEVTLTYTDGGQSRYSSSWITVNVAAAATAPAVSKLPNIVKTSPLSLITLNAGQKSTIEIELKNTGLGAASKILVLPQPSDKFLFAFEGGSNSYQSHLAGETRKVRLTVTAPSTASEASQLSFTCVYYDDDDIKHETAFSFYVKVNAGTSTRPNLATEGFSISKTEVFGGDEFRVSGKIRNISGRMAENVTIAATDLKSQELYIENGTNNVVFGNIDAGGEREFSFSFKAYSGIKTGSYPVNFNITYQSGATAYSLASAYYVSVKSKDGDGAAEPANIQIVSIAEPVGKYQPGQEFSVGLRLQNTGKAAAKSVKITAVTPEGIVPRSANIQQINSLAPGSVSDLRFSFTPTAAAKSQSHVIGFTIEYDNGAKKDDVPIIATFSQYVGVSVDNPQAADSENKNKSTPKIIVSEYKADPIIVMAGHQFGLDMVFRNTHATKGVYNIKAYLTIQETTEKKGNVFTPVDASNTFYIDEIPARGESAQHIRMYTVPDAQPRNYIILIKFEYEDADGNPLTAQEEIGINVKQVTSIYLGDLFVNPDVMRGEPVYLFFSVQNNGKVTLNNLKIKIEAEGFDTTGSEIIFGNFASGNSQYYDSQIFATTPGPTVIKVITSYDDDSGEHVERVDEYPVNILEGGGGFEGGLSVSPGFMEPPQNSENPVVGFIKSHLVIVITAAVVIVAAAVAIPLIIRARKNKKDDLL